MPQLNAQVVLDSSIGKWNPNIAQWSTRVDKMETEGQKGKGG